MESMPALPLCVVLVVVLVAAGTDLWKFRLHNALTIPLFLTGLLYHGVAGGASGLVGSVLGALVGSGPLLIPYTKGGMGAGDIKLMAGVGAWLGPWAILHVLIVSGLATGCYSVGLMVSNRVRRETRLGRRMLPCGNQPAQHRARQNLDVTAVLGRPDRRWNAVPFGAMVALGVIVTAVWKGGLR